MAERIVGDQPANTKSRPVREVELIISKITLLAESIAYLGELQLDENDLSTIHMLSTAACGLAKQVGWMADVVSKKLGGVRYYGGAEEWMLPAACRQQAVESE